MTNEKRTEIARMIIAFLQDKVIHMTMLEFENVLEMAIQIVHTEFTIM